MTFDKLNYIIGNNGGISNLNIADDEYKLNWVNGDEIFGVPYGSYTLISSFNNEGVINESYKLNNNIQLDVVRYYKDGKLFNDYVFINKGENEYNSKIGDLGIATPFNDNYESAEVCKTQRCHEHIWIADNSSYILARRMGGGYKNLAMLLTKGALSDYAMQRGWNSNDRGDTFVLLPPLTLAPNESYEIELALFSYIDYEDFVAKATGDKDFMGNFIAVSADAYSVQSNAEITIEYSYGIDTVITTEFGNVTIKNGKGLQTVKFNDCGEKQFVIEYDGKKTYIEFYVHDGLLSQIDKRLNFIIDKQQIHSNNKLNGAYMLYENDTQSTYIENKPINDRNYSRERMGIVASMMERLLNGKSLDLEIKEKYFESVRAHLEFIDKYIVKDSGKVCEAPKYKCNIFMHRLYNYSWAMLVYITAYELFDDNKYLIKATNIAREYYRRGGNKFYAINLPFVRIVKGCEKAGNIALAAEMKKLFLNHGDNVVAIGTDWPAHEVKYEQSIVAPSVDILLQCYELSNDNKYLNEVNNQMPLLEAFNGCQPSFHNNEVAIRHWDGFWFGKSRLYGDTFPHYWSCITAGVFSRYAAITDNKEYVKKADKCLYNNLCLIKDGIGSCAYIRPYIVNGKHAKFYDPRANDQDWLMWFNLRYNSEFANK